jgi:hypothetical protein
VVADSGGEAFPTLTCTCAHVVFHTYR